MNPLDITLLLKLINCRNINKRQLKVRKASEIFEPNIQRSPFFALLQLFTAMWITRNLHRNQITANCELFNKLALREMGVKNLAEGNNGLRVQKKIRRLSFFSPYSNKNTHTFGQNCFEHRSCIVARLGVKLIGWFSLCDIYRLSDINYRIFLTHVCDFFLNLSSLI